MSIFALQVEVGKEWLIKEKLAEVLKQYNCDSIENIYACESEINRGGVTRKIGELAGYIFIQLKDELTQIPSETWHLIKNIPRIFKILKHSIPYEEFNRFYESLARTAVIDIAVNSTSDEEVPQLVEEAEALQSDAEQAYSFIDLDQEDNAFKVENKAVLKAFKVIRKKTKAYFHLPSFLVQQYKQCEEATLNRKWLIRRVMKEVQNTLYKFQKCCIRTSS